MQIETLAQQLFFTTAFVQTSTSAGTAFVFNAVADGMTIPVLVTNKHVVQEEGPGSFSIIQANASDDGPELGVRLDFAHPTFSRLWVGHPNPGIDVAAAFLQPFLNGAKEQGKSAFFRAVSSELCPSPETLGELDAVEDVLFVGYPSALYDRKNLTPIIRKGITATPISLSYNDLPAFLIDASVFPGSSGSPVFVYQSGGYNSGGQFMLGQTRLVFVGLVAAAHTHSTTGQIVTKSPAIEVAQFMDLGIVFNHTAVLETVKLLLASRGIQSPSTESLAAQTEITQTEEPPQRDE